MEAGSAGFVRDESGKMSANLTLPFLSILEAQPPPLFTPLSSQLVSSALEVRLLPPAQPVFTVFIVKMHPLKRAQHLEGASWALQIAQNDAESQDIQKPVFPCG